MFPSLDYKLPEDMDNSVLLAHECPSTEPCPDPEEILNKYSA